MAHEVAQLAQNEAGPAGPLLNFFPHPLFHVKQGLTVPAARAAAGHKPGGPAVGGRTPAGRRRGRPASPSLSLFFSPSLSFPLLPPARHASVPAARPTAMAGRTSTGRTSGAGGGRRPKPRPGEAASMPPGLNQGTGWFSPCHRPGDESFGSSPPSLSLPVPHRTSSPVPVGSPAKAQARQGDGHAAEPEPATLPLFLSGMKTYLKLPRVRPDGRKGVSFHRSS